MKKYHILCLLILTFAKQAFPQSVNELVQEAINNNLSIKALEQTYQASLSQVGEVSRLSNPEVGIGTFPLPVETRLGAQTLRLSATQMFPWFGTIDQKQQVALSQSEVVRSNVAIQVLEVAYKVKEAYLGIYEIEKSQKILDRSIVLFEALEKIALSKIESGQATAADVLRIQLKIEELKQEQLILDNTKVSPVSRINQLLNRQVQTEINIEDSLTFAELPVDRDTFIQAIRADHPSLNKLKKQQEVSEQIIQLNTLDGKPTFGLGADYILINQRSDATPLNNGRDILQVKASVQIPLYRKKYQAKAQTEKLKITALAHQQEDMFTNFLVMIEDVYASYESAKLKRDLYEKQKTLTQSAISVLEANYSTQGQRFDELLSLQKELVDYDLKILKATVQSHRAKISLERFAAINN